METIEFLENDYWGEAPNNATPLIRKCYSLRKKPIKKLTVEDIRLLIGQNIGMRFLIPKAIEILRENPLAEGDFYKGDLLETVLRSDNEFWKRNKKLKEEVISIFHNKHETLFQELETSDEIKMELTEAYSEFAVKE